MPDAPVAPLSRASAPTRLAPGSANGETERLLLVALGLDAQASSSDRAASRAALAAYEAVLAREPRLDAIPFDDARPSWPTVLAIELAMARLSSLAGETDRCLARYEAILAAHPQGDGVEEAVRGAAVCATARAAETSVAWSSAPSPARRSRRGRRAPDPPLHERPLTEAELASASALHRFSCRAPQHPEAIAARYRHARILYEANHFDEAAALFRSFVLELPTHELAEYAANLYLDSLNILATHRPGRESACRAALLGEVDPLARLFCASEAERDAHPDLCRVLQQLRCDMLRSEAEHHAEAGRHGAAAQAYESIAREHRECGRFDELLYNAAVSWDAAHEPARAMGVREILLRQFPESALAERTLWAMAWSEHAIGRYEEAATRYEDVARRWPGADGSDCTEDQETTGRCPSGPVALSNALLLRLSLGDFDRAMEDAALFERNYARRRREETASLSASLVLALARRERWADVTRLGDGWVRRWAATAPSGQGLEVRAALGRAYGQQRSPRAAALWTVLADADLRAITDEIALARARDAVAEARLRVTDADTDVFLARRAPRANVAAWRAARDEELRSLRARLERVAELEVPGRNVEAIARIARLEAHLARETNDAGLLAQATERYASCLAHASATRSFGAISSMCFEALVAIAPDRFAAARELTAGARFVASPTMLPRPASEDEGDRASR